MIHINYLIKKTIKIKAKTLKHLKARKENEFIEKLYYHVLILVNVSRFDGQPKIPMQRISYCAG